MNLPSIAPRLRRGINAENIAGGRGVAYPLDTWTTLQAARFTHARIPCDMPHVDDAMGVVAPKVVADTLARLDATVVTLRDMGWAISLCPFGAGTLPNVAEIARTLGILTARYAPMVGPDQLAFELRNEPAMFSADQWNLAVPVLVAAIRAHAPLHTIVIPPVLHDVETMLASLTLVADPNVIYVQHFYEPAGLTQQGTTLACPPNPDYPFPAPPGTLGRTGLYTLDKLRLRLKIGSDWALAHNVPLMVGEFGCSSDAPPAARLAYASAMVSSIEALPGYIGWSFWGVDGKKFGLRPWKRNGAWDQPLLDALTGAMGA